jgi:hypothetical protein
VNAKLDIYVPTQTHATVNNDQPIATTRYTINNHLDFNKIISQIQGNITREFKEGKKNVIWYYMPRYVMNIFYAKNIGQLNLIYAWLWHNYKICVHAGKSSWPELLGAEGKVAAATIERENPLVEAIIVPEGSMVILDFRCDRVWVWVDKRGIVFQVPGIG